MGKAIGALGGILANALNQNNQQDVTAGINPYVDPHNAIVAQENRYAQMGIPNSTMLTQDIAGARNAAQQGSIGNQIQLAQLALQQNAQNFAQNAQTQTAAGTVAGAQPTGSTSSDGVPSSGTLDTTQSTTLT